MLDSHQPFERVAKDEATATDRQWLRMLNEAFADLDYSVFITAGMDQKLATNVLGLVAMTYRQEEK